MSSAVEESSNVDRADTEAISAEDLKRIGQEILIAHGASAGNAATQVRILVEGDLRGQPSHGIQRLPVLVGRIRSGVLDPTATPVVTNSAASVLVVDGAQGFGPVAGLAAVDALIDRAESTGVATALIHDANHLGMLAPYVERLTEAGLVGIAMTTSEALVHPWGGTKPRVGTNPLAIGVPTGPSSPPVVLDMSTGAVAAGKILNHAARGLPIPLGWAVDATGEPTTDAAAARGGALSPFGGPKGYALGVTLEVLVASLTGTALGTNVRGTLDVEYPSTKGDVLIGFSMQHLPGRFEEISAYLDDVRSTPTKAGGPPVVLPGDRARATREARLRDGVPVAAAIWRAISELQSEEGSER